MANKKLSAILRALAVLGMVAAPVVMTGCGDKDKHAKKKAAAPVVVDIPPPIPPPPVTPPPPKDEPPPEPKEQEMVQQEEIQEPTPEDPAPAPDLPQMGTNMKEGNGPDYGLAKGGSKGGGGGTGRIGGKGGGRFDRQASMIQNTIAGELRRNPKTKTAVFSGRVAVWVDTSGRITRAKAVGSLGSSSVDESVPAVLVGLQFPEALPSDMPMPVQMRVAGRKVN